MKAVHLDPKKKKPESKVKIRPDIEAEKKGPEGVSTDKALPEFKKPKADSEKKSKQLPPEKKEGRPLADEKAIEKKLLSLKIPIGMLALTLTEMLASARKDDRYIATDKEVRAIEDGFNEWIELRADLLMKLKPEFRLLVPIAVYFLRISRIPNEKKESTAK